MYDEYKNVYKSKPGWVSIPQVLENEANKIYSTKREMFTSSCLAMLDEGFSLGVALEKVNLLIDLLEGDNNKTWKELYICKEKEPYLNASGKNGLIEILDFIDDIESASLLTEIEFVLLSKTQLLQIQNKIDQLEEKYQVLKDAYLFCKHKIGGKK
jgi:hypothetical protein